MGTGRRIVLSFSFLVIVTGAFIVGFPDSHSWESERFALSEEEDRTVSIIKKAYDRLAWAKKEGETLSDVVIRLTSMTLEGLQRRGEKKIVTSDDEILTLEIDQGKCMGAESCVALAPQVFALDVANLGFGTPQEPLGMRDVMDREVDSDTIIRAAKSCPYQAIYVRDSKNSDEQIVP